MSLCHSLQKMSFHAGKLELYWLIAKEKGTYLTLNRSLQGMQYMSRFL